MSARVLRRIPQAEERIKLGPGKAAAVTPASNPVAAPSVAAETSERDRVLELRAREIADLQGKLAQSKQECEQLGAALVRVETGIAEARQLAKQQGYQEGLQQAQLQAERELEKCVAAWQRTVEQTSHETESRLQAIRSELAVVTMTAVTKIIGEHLLNPQSIRVMIEQTLKEAGIGTPARILLASAQYEQLTRSGASHVAALRERRIEIAPDPRVAYGGCLIEAAGSLVDGRLEVQLAGLKNILAGHYPPGSPAPGDARSIAR